MVVGNGKLRAKCEKIVGEIMGKMEMGYEKSTKWSRGS